MFPERYYPYSRNLILRARELRKNMTPAEKHLWYDYLSTAPVKFYRQRPIGGRYIVDFFGQLPRLVIEVDGNQHAEGYIHEQDVERDAYLNSVGLMVLRITNDQIKYNFDDVCRYIDALIKYRVWNVPLTVEPPPK